MLFTEKAHEHSNRLLKFIYTNSSDPLHAWQTLSKEQSDVEPAKNREIVINAFQINRDAILLVTCKRTLILNSSSLFHEDDKVR